MKCYKLEEEFLISFEFYDICSKFINNNTYSFFVIRGEIIIGKIEKYLGITLATNDKKMNILIFVSKDDSDIDDINCSDIYRLLKDIQIDKRNVKEIWLPFFRTISNNSCEHFNNLKIGKNYVSTITKKVELSATFIKLDNGILLESGPESFIIKNEFAFVLINTENVQPIILSIMKIKMKDWIL